MSLVTGGANTGSLEEVLSRDYVLTELWESAQLQMGSYTES